MNAVTIFTKSEEKNIIQAIEKAELHTSGEIRLHVEVNCTSNPYERALEVFYLLKMENTKERNGVLLYIAIKDRKLAIIGDQGIHEKLSNDFWDNIITKLQENFKNEIFAKGIIEAILEIGNQLSTYFPLNNDDKDELTNEISFS